MTADMVMSYVRDLLERLTGVRPQPDDDGDLPVEYAGALFYVRVVNPQDAIVQVFSVGIADIEPTPDLLAAINDINTRIDFARAFHVAGQVLIEAEIWGSDVNPYNFEHACRNVARATARACRTSCSASEAHRGSNCRRVPPTSRRSGPRAEPPDRTCDARSAAHLSPAGCASGAARRAGRCILGPWTSVLT